MAGIYERYRTLDYKLPSTYLSWDLFGAGLDNLGRDGKPVELPLRDPTPDELLLRVDALGLCFSDAKLIAAGSDHPRIRGRDLKTDPTVAGHEAAMTVAKVGSNWKSRFAPGQRFIIQADIHIGGEQKAFGYVQRGAMAQYAYVGPWVLDADGGCSLFPIQDGTGYAEAALVEPWACVENAYSIPEREQPVAGGRVLVVVAEPGVAADFGGFFAAPPKTLVVLGGADSLGGLPASAAAAGAPDAAGVGRAAEAAGGFTDIVLVGRAAPELIEACDAALAASGILSFVSPEAIPGKAALDIGRVHYELTRYRGTAGAGVAGAYGRAVRRELKPSGATWMVGAAGPMGQMHVQRALELPNPPATLFCTDLSDERLAYMEKRLAPLAERRGVRMVCLNVGNVDDLPRRIAALTDSAGFDDIYIHAPVPVLAEQAAEHLAANANLNIFAGVGIGTKAKFSPEIFRALHTRLIGSSGSSMEDFVNTLRKMEAGRLATRMSLAALGGIEATWQGIKGVKENRFPGKTVIFPQIRGIPLTGIDALPGVSAAAAAALENGALWTNGAERILFENALSLD